MERDDAGGVRGHDELSVALGEIDHDIVDGQLAALQENPEPLPPPRICGECCQKYSLDRFVGAPCGPKWRQKVPRLPQTAFPKSDRLVDLLARKLL